jgi:hypothetical protein
MIEKVDPILNEMLSKLVQTPKTLIFSAEVSGKPSKLWVPNKKAHLEWVDGEGVKIGNRVRCIGTLNIPTSKSLLKVKHHEDNCWFSKKHTCRQLIRKRLEELNEVKKENKKK